VKHSTRANDPNVTPLARAPHPQQRLSEPANP
jgi:hypothetical protein